MALACVYLVLCAHTLQEERGRERRRGTGRERKSTPTWSRNLIKQVKVSNCLGEIILPLMKTGKGIGEGEGVSGGGREGWRRERRRGGRGGERG